MRRRWTQRKGARTKRVGQILQLPHLVMFLAVLQRNRPQRSRRTLPKSRPTVVTLRKQRFMKPLRKKKLLIGGSHCRVLQLFHSLSYLIDFLSLLLVNLSAY
ncbi:hypothetical protein EUGRSUZ_K00999 [Eucalyptus grandis]|uniref:Uncharacterized protein n=2 Tax=Eucalyptus grandis TaxID=71139 RepID=A0ACC3IS04_EUCGR|nr:hypothetical protein EUGRSUZ_K00999 [Eucalyptus grandis]